MTATESYGTNALEQRLFDLVGKYQNFAENGQHGHAEYLWTPEQIDHFLPEEISCIKDAETALETTWYKLTGEHELIQKIVGRVKQMLSASAVKSTAQCEGQYSFVFIDGMLKNPAVA